MKTITVAIPIKPATRLLLIESLNPHSLIDTQSDTVITPIQYWDPARNHHYYIAENVIDLQLDSDPALYSTTMETLDDQYVRIANGTTRTAEQPWARSRVGTNWLDMSVVDYIPYYDSQTIPNVDDRLQLWGELSDWADIVFYTWVESDVQPSEWNDLVVEEQGDSSISELKRKSGSTFQTLYEKVGGNWKPVENVVEHFDVAFDSTYVIGTYEYVPNIDFTRQYYVFVNGQQLADTEWYQYNVPTPRIRIPYGNINDVDRVTVVQFAIGKDPYLSDADNIAAMEQAVADDSVNYALDYQYTTDTYIDQFGQEQTLYYFWVKNKATKGTRVISPASASQAMKSIPIPYVSYHDIQQAQTVVFEDTSSVIPIHFTKAVISGLRNLIDDDQRYAIRWTRDQTLRDTLDTGISPLEKKLKYQQWELIRKDMPYHIPRWLWDKVTESIIGYKLTDSTIRVPSYLRELYDEENETDTRFGIGDGQAFTDGTLALSTILEDLNNPNNDFAPVDINVFFNTYAFDTNDEIIASMDAIYNTFPYNHVNRMFFEVLLDAFSKKSKYEGIFKTSMIALNGVRPFQVGGLFDD